MFSMIGDGSAARGDAALSNVGVMGVELGAAPRVIGALDGSAERAERAATLATIESAQAGRRVHVLPPDPDGSAAEARRAVKAAALLAGYGAGTQKLNHAKDAEGRSPLEMMLAARRPLVAEAPGAWTVATRANLYGAELARLNRAEAAAERQTVDADLVATLTRERDEARAALSESRAKLTKVVYLGNQENSRLVQKQMLLTAERDQALAERDEARKLHGVARTEVDQLRHEVTTLLADVGRVGADPVALRRWFSEFYGSARQLFLTAGAPTHLVAREPTAEELPRFKQLFQGAPAADLDAAKRAAEAALAARVGADPAPPAAVPEPPRAARSDPAVGRAVARALGASAGLRCPW